MAKRICPCCSSENIEPEVADFSGFLHSSINKWECNDCEYVGLAPEKTNEQSSDSKDTEPSPGLTYRQYLVIIIVAAITGLLMLSLL